MSVPVDRGSLRLDEPALRCEAVRGPSPAWPFALVALVLYGSLIPFDFNWSHLRWGNGFGLLQLAICSTTLEDALTNVLVYVPLGAALALTGVQKAWWLRGLLRAIIIGVAVSLTAESLQTAIAIRVPSWTDVALNVLGLAVGASVAIRANSTAMATVRWTRSCLKHRPYATLASMVVIGLFVFGLAPFDFVTSTDELHGAFRRAGGVLLSRNALTFNVADPAIMLDEVAGALWFCALAYLLGLSARRNGRNAMAALGSAIKHGIIVATLLELLQLFTLSHAFEPVAIALHWVAVALGAWGGVFIVDDLSSKECARRPRLAVPVSLLGCLVALQVLLLLASGLNSSIRELQAFDASSIRWIAFETLWLRPMPVALVEASTGVLAFGTLAFTLMMMLRRCQRVHVVAISGAIVFLTALCAEFLQSCTVSGTADLTGPALAVFAFIGVHRLCKSLWPDGAGGSLPAIRVETAHFDPVC